MNSKVRRCIVMALMWIPDIHAGEEAQYTEATRAWDITVSSRISYPTTAPGIVSRVDLENPTRSKNNAPRDDSQSSYTIQEVSIWTLPGVVLALGLLRLFRNSKKHPPVSK